MVKRYIYFPFWNERPSPVIIYVLREYIDDIMGSAVLEEIEQGRFARYPRTRCQPYTENLWKACCSFSEKLEGLRVEYEGIRSGKAIFSEQLNLFDLPKKKKG